LLYLRKNPKLDSQLKFYIYQGPAFFRFSFSQFHKAKKWGLLAYSNSFESRFEYGQMLSQDLIGHCLVQIGEIRKGLNDLKQALKISNSIGNGGNKTALIISILLYEVQFGMCLKSAEKKLYQALSELTPEDTYSKNEIILELSRQLVLRGKVGQAQNILDQNSNEIYKFQNKYQAAIFNLRYANILKTKAEPHASLTLLRTAKFNLDPRVDILAYRQIEGLEREIKKNLNIRDLKDETHYKYLNFLDQRISGRSKKLENRLLNVGEDPLGDLIDKLQTYSIENLMTIISSQLFGLLPKVLNLKMSQSFIYLGPHRGQMLIYSKGDAFFVNSGVTSTMKKLLEFLSQKSDLISKQDLIETVWEYKYNPEIHDRLLHSTVSKIRKIIAPFSSWIEWSGGSYFLSKQILILKNENYLTSSQKHFRPLLIESKLSENKKIDSDLNFRQIQMLHLLEKNEFTDISSYAKKFKISKITACRDLSVLFRKHLLVRTGKGRATKYLRIN